jgi:hypothetical protein
MKKANSVVASIEGISVGSGNSRQRRAWKRHPKVRPAKSRFERYWDHRQDRLGREASRREAALLRRIEANKPQAPSTKQPAPPMIVAMPQPGIFDRARQFFSNIFGNSGSDSRRIPATEAAG